MTAAFMTTVAVAVVVVVPGLAAAWWIFGRGGRSRTAADVACRIAVAYAGLGVAALALWLTAIVAGLSWTTSVGAPLAGAAVLAAAAILRNRRAGQAPHEADPPVPAGERRVLAWLGVISLASVCLVAIPFAPYGWERADGVHRMAMTDWEKHLVMTTAVAASPVFPPPHPYIHDDPRPSYYFGFHLVAAAISRVTEPPVTIFAALWVLTLLTAAATPFVVFAFARDLTTDRLAVVAAGASTLLVGFDALVLALEAARAAILAWPIPGGLPGLRAVIPSTHLDWWLHNVDRSFSAPIVTTMWAPHQTAATLIALVVLYLLAPRPDDPSRARAGWLLPALLIGALPALSSYLAMGLGVGVAAAALTEAAAGRRAPWRTAVFHRFAWPGSVGVALALPLVPTLVHGSSSGLEFHVSAAGTWTNGALFTWLLGPGQIASTLDTPAVFLIDLGLMALLGIPEILRLRRTGALTPVRQQAAAVAIGILLLVTFVRPPIGIGNNLYARAVLLPWFALAPFAAMAVAGVTRRHWFHAAVLVSVLGTCYVQVGYLLEGALFWATPAASVDTFRWVNGNTPRGALVAVRPADYENNYGYWLRRPLVLGGRRLAVLFGADPAHYDRTSLALERAYASGDAVAAGTAFDAFGADVILVRRSGADPDWAVGPCFLVAHRTDAWTVVIRTLQGCPRSP